MSNVQVIKVHNNIRGEGAGEKFACNVMSIYMFFANNLPACHHGIKTSNINNNMFVYIVSGAGP